MRNIRSGLRLAAAVLVALGSMAMAQPTLTTLATFNGVNGFGPNTTLVLDSAGNLYGTTAKGGSAYVPDDSHGIGGVAGNGTVFMLAAGSHAVTSLTSFSYNSTGDDPQSKLLLDGKGNLYGTTYQGGLNDAGTIFEVNIASHSLNTVLNFNRSNGAFPRCGLTAGVDGMFYGQTTDGGTSLGGVLFQLSPTNNSVTTLLSMNGVTDAGGLSELVRDPSGVIYGSGFADVYAIAPDGSNFRNLTTFIGSGPLEGVALGPDGKIYGTLLNGGTSVKGSVFVLDPNTKQVSTLGEFDGANGRSVRGAPIVDAAGNVFGVTSAGGAFDRGTIYEIDAATHTITTLVTFDGSNGIGPSGGLVADFAGNLYGTAGGPDSALGSVFEITNSGFVVPEPSSLALLGIGSIALLRKRTRGV